MENLNKEYWQKRAELAEDYLESLKQSWSVQKKARDNWKNFISSPDTTMYEEKRNYQKLFENLLAKKGMGYTIELIKTDIPVYFHKIDFWTKGTDYEKEGITVQDEALNDVYKEAFDELLLLCKLNEY